MKRTLQQLDHLLACLHSWPRVVALRWLGALIGKRVKLYGNYARLPWFGASGLDIGDDVQISGWSAITIKPGGLVSIAAGTGLGNFTQIFCANQIYIGSGCLFSDFVKVSDSVHIHGDGRSPVLSGLRPEGRVIIGNNVFVGQGVVIEPGVEVGDGCVIGAYAVLTKNTIFPPNSLIVGQPARIAKVL